MNQINTKETEEELNSGRKNNNKEENLKQSANAHEREPDQNQDNDPKQKKDSLLNQEKEEAKMPSLRDLVPAKFIDTKTGEINWISLIKSYLALEKKMSTREQPTPLIPFGTRPKTPEEYHIDLKSQLMNIDPEMNQKLFDLGFTNEQLQAVYDLAAEKVIPMIQEMSLDYKTDRELAELEKEFGGAERFNTIARQLSAWGEKNLDKSLFNVLASNKEGIMALYKMMCNQQEEKVLPQKNMQVPADTEETLRRLMQDPKYWKQQDPKLVKRIEEGFKKLYG